MGAETESNTLTHYGVKGMRWGVRRTPKQLRDARRRRGQVLNDTVTDDKGNEVRAVIGRSTPNKDGGFTTRLTPASADTLRAMDLDDVLKEFGSAALSNKDLSDYMARVDLERKYNTLQAQQNEASKSSGRKFVEDLVKRERDAYLKTGKPGPVSKLIINQRAGRKSSPSDSAAAAAVALQVRSKHKPPPPPAPPNRLKN